jgi:hypothetical protein
MSELPSDVWFLIVHHSEQGVHLLKQIRCICLAAYSACAYYMRVLLRSRLHFAHLIPGCRANTANWSIQSAENIEYDKNRVQLGPMGTPDNEFDEPMCISVSIGGFFSISSIRCQNPLQCFI